LAPAKEKVSQVFSSYEFTSPLDKSKIKQIDKIVKEICKKEGVEIKWKEYPPLRASIDSEGNKKDSGG